MNTRGVSKSATCFGTP